MAAAGNGNPEGVKTVNRAVESILQEGLPIVHLEPVDKPFTEPLKVKRKSYARIQEVHPTPNLIEVQLESYKGFQKVALRELFDEISPIQSFNKALELYFLDYWFEEPKYSEKQCRAMDLTYGAPLWVRSRLINKDTGEIQEQDVFMGDFPLMTSNGTFIVNGAERVVVSQLIRSPGVYFTVEEDRATGRELAGAKLIPSRGAWLEFETSKRDVLSVKVDRKRKLPATVLLRASGLGSDDDLFEAFEKVDTVPEHSYIASTIDKDPTKNQEDALLEFYKKLRPGDPATLENARNYLNGLLFQARRYDLGRVGRHKLNRRLELDIPLETRTLTLRDLVAVVGRLITINNGVDRPDDIDHLGNRRVKTVGELIQQQLRIGLLRMERVVRERMSIRDPEQLTPISLINIRPVVAATREFFGGSQLSQFMQQTNPLDELTHKRRLSALGPGGLRRERAGFDVRDVHHSHYGRICPIETPEGPNIGLIGSLATFATINEFGFIETPYRRVIRSVPNDGQSVVGHILWEDVKDGSGQVIAPTNGKVDEALAKKLRGLPLEQIDIVPQATGEIEYLAADDEDKYIIAQANVRLDDEGRFLDRRVSVRYGSRYHFEDARRVHYVDVSPKQIVSVSASLIPFLEHDDANRALMGSNMQRQAVPLIKPEAPIVATGMEHLAALDSGQVVVSEHEGEVVEATSARIVIRTQEGEEIAYPLRKYQRSNQSTCIDQRPVVERGDRVRKGEVIADSASTDKGELALGQNVLVAFMSWEGGNYEDAVLISDELVRSDKFASIHIEKHEVEARDTKLGPEEITRDIPNVGEEALHNLDENGVIRIGAEVDPGDILVGKITPKGETDLTPEEKLLRAIFGEKAREVKDSSLRLPHGEKGKVVEVREFTREDHQDLAAGVEKMVRVAVAQQRKVTEGDKMAGRHGNKGVISKVVPMEDMPFTEDGTPVQMILNPLGVPARMNIGQILETHLGWSADRLGFKVVTPVFDGAREREIAAELARAWVMDEAWRRLRRTAWNWLVENGHSLNEIEDNERARQTYLAGTVPGDYDRDHIREDVAYARRVAMSQFLRREGYDPDKILSFGEKGRRPREREALDDEALRACYRLWMQKHGASVKGAPSLDELEEQARELSRQVLRPLPTSGKMRLFDGKTGEPFDQPVTVGIIYMLKLAHLVEDKVHARSTGPYSLVTQQPLGGKAQFGGQRFGEMEVWALEAYGAAHILQEMLTVKSDDVTGRVKTYESIVKGEKIKEPGVPESFRVLVKELQSLGLSVEVLDDKGEVLHFGRDDGDDRLPRLALGLGRPRY